ncbi:UNVERIFIED_CONTAM: hypothetical protein GTU68_029110 [Idotea baltica]|nr:hypothetical protein [Idotea baltica]
MIQRVYEQAMQAKGLTEVIVATDDQRIFQTVEGFGGKALMTRTEHPTGTDRLLEVVGKFPDFDAYVNVQGDEPLIDPQQIDALCALMFRQSGAFVGTLIKKLDLDRELQNPNVIKVVKEQAGKAIYFSRLPIPYAEHGYWKHIGMYGYSREAISRIKTMPPGRLEKAESLEQLRWMEQGLPIWTEETEIETKGVDAPEDLEEVLALLKAAAED